MPLLILPLIVIAVFGLWVLLLPLSLWQRYRLGRARRRPQPWMVRGNAWLLLASLPPWFGGAWVAGHWVPHALRDAGLGLAIGVLAGIASLWMTRFERDAEGLAYTPNRWLVLAMTSLLALRVALAGIAAWRHWQAGAAVAGTLPHAAGLVLVGGVLLGYQLAYTWGLRARLAPSASRVR